MDDIDGSPTASTVGEYAYNGLNWRIMRQADTDLDNDLDQQRMMYYSATPGMWQLLEEDVWDGWTAQTPGNIDRHVQYVWGARYIDDIIMRREDRDTDGDYEVTTTDDIARYYLTDVQFSPVAIVDQGATMIERISYTPYGEARHHRMADLDADGDTDYQDYVILQNNLNGFGAADINYDGVVDGDDNQALWADWGAGLAACRLSYASEDNIIGYDGYIFNVETCEYTVRFRNYSPLLGRWMERDPVGYVDSANLFEYARSKPTLLLDPTGLISNLERKLRQQRLLGEPMVPNGIAGAPLDPRAKCCGEQTEIEIDIMDYGRYTDSWNFWVKKFIFNEHDVRDLDEAFMAIRDDVRAAEAKHGKGCACIKSLNFYGHAEAGEISVGAGTGMDPGADINGSDGDLYPEGKPMPNEYLGIDAVDFLSEFAPYMCPDATVRFYGCNTGSGRRGRQFLQGAANALGCPAVGFDGLLSGYLRGADRVIVPPDADDHDECECDSSANEQ